jgi:hypothetical protein
MTDWLMLILQIGGVGAVVALAVAITGKWLWEKFNAAFDSYVTAYSQQQANINARIANLQKLAEEQAQLTRTVESIKDEIAAQAKSRDNRWAFRKDIYCQLVAATSQLLDYEIAVSYFLQTSGDPKSDPKQQVERLHASRKDRQKTLHSFFQAIALAPLATADEIRTAISGFRLRLKDPDTIEDSEYNVKHLSGFLDTLQNAGRKDLWGTPEPEAKAEAANQST